MPQQVTTAVTNNFTKGLVTEFTGLNFPENAATDTDNCNYTLIGDVERRLGYDLEANFHGNAIDRTGKAVSSYKWNNVAGQGEQQFLVTQVGSVLYFWDIDASTVASPLSNRLLGNTVDVSSFVAAGGTFDATKECQFFDGNGYLFVYHPSCDPFYCTFASGVVTGNPIAVQIRDFTGIFESGVPDNFRSTSLTDVHNYNIQNQGWITKAGWSATSTTLNNNGSGVKTWTIQTGLTIGGGDSVNISCILSNGKSFSETGTVTSYTSGTGVLVLNVSSVSGGGATTSVNWTFVHPTTSYIATWLAGTSTYPSNADVWWRYKDTTNTFSPSTTIDKVTLQNAPAPKGHFFLDAFNQDRTSVSSIPNLTVVSTTVRPRTGTWFQGRVWYTGVDDSFTASGTAAFSTWTENIYFSQIIQSADQFGKCYQLNDPTDQDLFGLLPTDGGVIVIQGSGPIFKLFPIQNGMLIFAANGVWFLTGSQGIGFAANDYTITKLSSIKSNSSTSFVDVQGLPYFWNEEGIYSVQPTQTGSLSVTSITYTTIDTLFNEIPLTSKKFARGDYDPINYTLRWIYRDTEATDVTGRYSFNKVLNYNTNNKAFYPYTLDTTQASICSINYVAGPGGSTCPPPIFKHLTSYGGNISFSEERGTSYADWSSISPVNYTSYFVTGYRLRGQAMKKFQLQYIQVYSRVDGTASSYRIQGIWDYANSRNSGRWTSIQSINIGPSNFDVIFKRHKIRGNGYAMQFKILSTQGMPFDIIGWAAIETVNAGT